MVTKNLTALVAMVDKPQLWRLCREFSFRHQLVRWAAGVKLAAQIRLMRQARGWSPSELARRAGLRQSTIWRIERNAALSRLSTLVRIAAAFDCAFVVRFTSWSVFIDYVLEPPVIPVSFDEENSPPLLPE